jgi:hypothetical protein
MPVQILFNNLTPVTPDFIADEQTAAAILAATFTNNITLTFDVRFGFSAVGGAPLDPLVSDAAMNNQTAIYTNYTNLRTTLLTNGQPNFFTPTNLPAGNGLPINNPPPGQQPVNMSNFYISSSEAKAFGMQNIPAGVDGFIGIGTGFTPGTDRVATLLHEITHAMGRVWFNVTLGGVTYAPVFDLMRFFSFSPPGTPPLRSFDGSTPVLPVPPLGNPPLIPGTPVTSAYFSIDGGVTRLADWAVWNDASDFLNPQNTRLPAPYSNRAPNDPFNEVVTLGTTPARLTTADILSVEALGFTSTVPVVNPAPPAATTAVMVLRQTSAPPTITDGTYNIYDIGNNQILANFQLGKIGAPWQFVTLGGFNDGDTSDMMLRNATTNQFLLYDIAPNNNNFTPGGAGISLIPPGALGSEWQVLAFANFSSIPGETDMMLRRSSDGMLLIDDIRNNQITGSFFTGPVGTDWQFSGVGNFSSNPDGVARDLMLRRVSDGALQVYNFANNQLTGSSSIGPVGPDWQFSGVGNFSSIPGESDLLLRLDDPALPNNGALQLYDIANNALGPSYSLGRVGPDFQFAGVASIRGAGPASDLILRRASDGLLQGYNIANNALGPAPSLGATGGDWQLPQFPGGGFAADPPSASTASMGDPGQAAQLAQAMADPGGDPVDPSAFSSSMLNPAPSDATTANMVLRNASTPTATYQIYNLGANSILAGYPLAQVGSDWGFVTLGNFNLSDPSDMLLRNSTSGAFQVYDIADNNVVSSSSLGAVGSNWQVLAFGTFGPFAVFGETDMILRDVNTGMLQVYNIDNNQITHPIPPPFGPIGLDWQFSGIGNFSGAGTSDLLMRNSNTGGLQVYNISNNQITHSAFIGTVGTDWQFSGVGNFSSVPGESDLLLRNSSTGQLEVLDINNNQVTGSASIGTIGLDWQFAGVAPVHDATTSDLVLRNVNTGAFQVYNIANNQLTGSTSLGQVGSDWQLGGFAPATNSGLQPVSGGPADSSSQPAAMDGSTSQLVQAMAGFGGSGAAISNTAPLGTEASQQPLLTTPHA